MEELEPIPLSALQHYLYCPRQCALIHVERIWAENRQTAEGRLLHEKTDVARTERRRGVRTVTSMPLFEATLGIVGVADVVEFHAGDSRELAFPVEYKRGRPKAHRADEVQLCAQALCLEAMLDTTVRYGALFYGEPRRRTEVVFDDELRRLTLDTIARVRLMIETGATPAAKYSSRLCEPCSLIADCCPRILERPRSVQDWLLSQLKE